MPRLLQNERERAVGMFQAGMTQTEIANHLNCSRMTIYQLLVRVRATGTASDRRRSGRPRGTMLRQDRHITLIHLRNCVVTAVDTARRTSGIVTTEFLTKQFVMGCVSLVSVHVALSKVWS
jgi:transposase